MSIPTPVSEPPWLMGLPSPYYNDSHRAFQKSCREFISEHLTEHVFEWEAAGEVPPHVFETFRDANMLIPNMPAPLPVERLRSLGLGKIGGGLNGDRSKGFKDQRGVVDVADWDYTHVSIYIHEMNMSGINGPAMSMCAGYLFGIPPIIKFGSRALGDKFLPDLLTGKKRTCIAVTEPDAGSDVANVTTTAVKTKDGKHYVVNGAKKWITNGIWADYATMCVRTSDAKGAAGLSVLIVPLKGEGVEMRKIKTSMSGTSGTTFIDLEDVKVPVENLVGEEGKGMFYIMTNFNHERLAIAISSAAQARVAVASALRYVMKREAFGKPLIEQPVVRQRLAKATAELESLWAWVEQFVYQMKHLSKEDADRELGGLTALAKARAGIVLNECAQCAVLLFGGNGLTATGQGQVAEHIYREVMAARIPGGSEDVMQDLSIRQLVKNFEKKTRELEKQSKL